MEKIETSAGFPAHVCLPVPAPPEKDVSDALPPPMDGGGAKPKVADESKAQKKAE